MRPQTQGGVMYNPITGQQQLWDWDAASKTWGVFVQDTWKARRNLTLTLGLRFDNQGNPYSRSDSTVFGNFLLGTGSTFEQQVANGVASPSEQRAEWIAEGLESAVRRGLGRQRQG